MTAIAMSVLVLTSAHHRLPEPRPAHIGFAATAASFSETHSNLGSAPADLLERFFSITDQDPSSLFSNDVIEAAVLASELSGPLLATSPRAFALFYTAAFLMFGSTLQSVILLWARVFSAGIVLALLAPLSLRGLRFVALTTMGVVITLGAVPLLDHNSWSVVNYRVVPLLAVVPATAVIVSAIEGRGPNWWAVPSAPIIGFAVAVRPTTVWFLLGLIGALIFSRQQRRRNGTVEPPRPPQRVVIVAFLFALLLPMGWFLTLQDRIDQSQEENKPISDAIRFHSLAISLFVDPRLYEQHVCTDTPIETELRFIRHQECPSEPIGHLNSILMATDPRNRYDDQHGYHAALRGTSGRDRNGGLVLDDVRFAGDLSQFNLDWGVYGVEARRVFLDTLRQNPIIAAQNFVIVKPVRALLTLGLQPVLVLRGITTGAAPLSAHALLALGILGSFLIVLDSRSQQNGSASSVEPPGRFSVLGSSGIAVVLVSAALPVLVFYAESHAILDLGALVWAAAVMFFLPIASAAPDKLLLAD